MYRRGADGLEDVLGLAALLAAGIALVVKGGDLFVSGAVWIAEASGLPKFLVGATLVSLATTLPELLVSVMGAGKGQVDLAVGNAVGSVSANTGLILGLSALCLPTAAPRRSIGVQMLLMALAAAVLYLLCRDGSLGAGPGALLLGIFLLYLWAGVASARGEGPAPAAAGLRRRELPWQLLRFLLGLGGIVWGADLLIGSGSRLALRLGIPAGIIGVTLVAIGTSLPELMTAIAALARGESALSVGNIIGANIIDLTLILPLCALLRGGSLPISPQGTALDLPACLALVLLAAVPALLSRRFSRLQGALLLAAYGGYLLLLA